MPIPNTAPFVFTAKGLADAYDSSLVFAGACRKLQNFVFDQSNPELIIARPGVDGATINLSSIAGAGFISCAVLLGDYVYGMVASSLTPGFDQAFCYRISTSSVIAVSGQTAGNAEARPASQPTSGDWTPLTIAAIGTKLVITSAGYAGGTNMFGVIDISNPAAPAYSTGHTSPNNLPSVPTAVANFNNRAYFICGNQLWYTDVLNPLSMTNATQSLTLGSERSVIALAGLPVQTATAGVVGALIAFKANSIWQITGDATTLALNFLSLTVGCSAPRSVAQSPLGIFFAGPDSAYLVNPLGAIVPVGQELRQPFNYIQTPTRAAGAFAGNIYRLCMQTIIDGVSGTYDYWFDTKRMKWNGPHTFTYDNACSAGKYFFLSSASISAKMFASWPIPFTGTLYTDNGSSYYCDVVSAQMPKHDEMAMKQVVETTSELSANGTWAFNFNLFDDNKNYIISQSMTTSQGGATWGSNKWGDGSKWTSVSNAPVTYRVSWSYPVVFNKLAIEILTQAGQNVGVGTTLFRVQKTGYMLQS